MITQYLNKLKNTNVFNYDSFNKAIDKESGAYKVIIRPENTRTLSKDKDLVVTGVINGGINFSTSTNWGELELDSDLGSLMSNVPYVSELRAAVGFATKIGGINIESDLQSKKFYTGGSFLNFPLSFKILDDDNSGKVLSSFGILMALTMPRNNTNINIKDTINGLLGKLATTFPDAEKVATSMTKTITETISNGLDIFKGSAEVIQRGASELVNSDIRVTESPVTVEVTVGHWFLLQNMVIDSVDVNFSEQMNEVGPLFAEFNLNLSSRNKLILGEEGIINGQGRIKFISSKIKGKNNV